MQDKFDWLPLYWQRFYIGTVKMRAEEVGAYLLLLIYEWDKGFVPTTEADIVEIARLPMKKLSRVLGKFRQKEGKYYNDTLEAIRIEQREKRLINSGRGKKGADARWNKNAQAMPEHAQAFLSNGNKNREEENRIDKNKDSVYETSKNWQDLPGETTEGNTTSKEIETGNSSSPAKSSQPTIFRTYAEYTALGAVLNDQGTWKENVQRKYKLSVEEVNRWIGAWLDHIKTLAETTYYLKDAQSFCANWIGSEMRKQPKTPSGNGKQVSPAPSGAYSRRSPE